MRRYRIMPGTFDTRAVMLTKDVSQDWEPRIQALHWENKASVLAGLRYQYGEQDLGRKLADFVALGTEPFSVLAYHNRFLRQSRDAFIVGAYYPALTAICALGERILNHLVRALRDDFQNSPEYKRVYRKNSFDNWDLAIDTLEAWGIWLPGVVEEYRTLKVKRHEAIHFRPEVDDSVRGLAIEAIKLLGSIIDKQFGALPPKPWFMENTRGEVYIRGDAEDHPFVRHVLIPSALHVGPKHTLNYDETTGAWRVEDGGQAGPPDGTDAEFLSLRKGLTKRTDSKHAHRS